MEEDSRLVFHKERLFENIDFMNDFMERRNLNWTFIIKAFNKYSDSFITELTKSSCKSIGSDNSMHLHLIKLNNPSIETWFLNYNGEKVLSPFIDVNLTHSKDNLSKNTCLMLAIDPFRHGATYTPDLRCEKYGAYLDCENIPNMKYFDAWKKLKLPPEKTQSLGTSVSFKNLDFLMSNGINHFRLGEIILTGKNIIDQTIIRGLRTDVFTSKRIISYFSITIHST
jgi:hypothetical protein